ncbi:MAG: STAS/SEC14 domain-containing protein [Cyclobacteriaceae bacterium]
MLTIPANAKIIDLTTSTLWFDENGILCSISKKASPQTLELARQTLKDLRQYIGNDKVCMLIDATHTSETSREIRDFAAEELPKIAKAIALMSRSSLGKMLANLFFKLKAQPYPVKMFDDEQEAVRWLRQYL